MCLAEMLLYLEEAWLLSYLFLLMENLNKNTTVVAQYFPVQQCTLEYPHFHRKVLS